MVVMIELIGGYMLTHYSGFLTAVFIFIMIWMMKMIYCIKLCSQY